MPDFRLADAEFDRQATILENLVQTVETLASKQDSEDVLIAGNILPTLPTGAQNTMAASAVVLIASHFEEYIRQQIQEFARGLLPAYAGLPAPLKERMLDVYWRGGVGKLIRISPKNTPLWDTRAEPVLRSLSRYPVTEDIGSFNPEFLCEHDHNMRWSLVSDMSGRVGVKKLSNAMFLSRALKTLLNVRRIEDLNTALTNRLNDFYELRNGIVHSIAQNTGIGASTFAQWATFFRVLTTAYAEALDERFRDVSPNP